MDGGMILKECGGNSRPVILSLLFAVLVSLAWSPDASAADPDLYQMNGTTPDAGETTIYLPLLFSWNRAPRERTVFGVQMYGNTGMSGGYFESLKRSKASWARSELYWAHAERENTTPDNFDWRSADRSAGAAIDGNYHMILTVAQNPRWAASTANGPIDKVDLSEFAEFIAAAVERYDGDGVDDAPGSPVVEYFEFYNEPDYETSELERSAWGDYPAEYAAMLAAVYPAVKAANPDAQVLFGGIAYDWFQSKGGPFVEDFLPETLAAGAGDYFDVMSFHQYPPFAPNWADIGPGLYEKTEAVRAVLADYGYDKPIIISESGMHSNNTNNIAMTEQLQSRYVVQLYAQSIAADLGVMIWFSLFDPPEWYPFKNGLVTADDPPRVKESMTAYRTAVQLLAGVRADAVLSAAETGSDRMLAYRFRDDADGRTVYVAWMHPFETTEQASLQIPAARATRYDLFGTKTTLLDRDDGQQDGMVTVTVSAQPLYLEVTD